MLQTLEALRKGTLRYCGDPSGDLFNPGGDFEEIDALINEAYQDVTDVVDESLRPWNAPPFIAPGTTPGRGTGTSRITPISAIREYAISPTTGVRRVLDVVEIQSDSSFRRTVPQTSWGLRDDLTEGVYVFRANVGVSPGIDNTWYVGICDYASTPYALLEVNWLRLPDRLAAANDFPVEVPASFHELIYYLAAVKAKMLKKQDPAYPAGLFSAGIAKMVRMLSKPVHSGSAERLSSRRLG